MNHYDSDYNKVLHSSIFRKLAHKQQLYLPFDNSFCRNRLTHSLEVAAIAKSILEHLDIPFEVDEDAIMAAALLHDVGLPPFGHTGESALNNLMIEHGGFNGNAQNIRLITKLHPLGLKAETIGALIKNPIIYSCAVIKKHLDKQTIRIMKDKSIVKALYDSEEPVLESILNRYNHESRELLTKRLEEDPKAPAHKETVNRTFSASVVSMADSIAYSVYDTEDHIKMRNMHNYNLDVLHFDPAMEVNWAINSLSLAEHVCDKEVEDEVKYYIIMSDDRRDHIQHLKELSYKNVIEGREKCISDSKNYNIIVTLFNRMLQTKHLLIPAEFHQPNTPYERVVCDYIASMSDLEATNLYNELT